MDYCEELAFGQLCALLDAAKVEKDKIPVRGIPRLLLRDKGERLRALSGDLEKTYRRIVSFLPDHMNEKLEKHIVKARQDQLNREQRQKLEKLQKERLPNFLYNGMVLFYMTPELTDVVFQQIEKAPQDCDKRRAHDDLMLPHRIILQFLNIAENAPMEQHLSVDDGFMALKWLVEHTNLNQQAGLNESLNLFVLNWPYAVVAYQRVIEALRRWDQFNDQEREELLLVFWALQVLTIWHIPVDESMAICLMILGVPKTHWTSIEDLWKQCSNKVPHHLDLHPTIQFCPPEQNTSPIELEALLEQIDLGFATLDIVKRSPLDIFALLLSRSVMHLQSTFTTMPPSSVQVLSDYFLVHPNHAQFYRPNQWNQEDDLLRVYCERLRMTWYDSLQALILQFNQSYGARILKNHWQSQLQSLQTLAQESSKQADLREILTYLNRATCLHFADQDWADWQSLYGEWIKALQQCQQLLDQERQQAQAAAQQQHLDELVQQLTNLAKQALDVWFLDVCDDEKQATLRADVLALLATAFNLPAGALNALQTWQENLPNVLSLSDFEAILRSLKQAQQALDAPPQDAELWQAQMANLRAAIDLAAELAAAPTSDVLPETLPDVVADVSSETAAAPDLSADNKKLRNKIKELDNKNHALAAQKFSDLYQSEEGKWQQWADDVLRLLDKQGTRPEQILSAAADCFVDVLEVLPSALKTAAQYRRAEYSAKELLLAIYKLCRVYLPLYLQGGDNLARHTFGQKSYSAQESDLVRKNERMRQQREFVYRGQKTLFIQHLRINAYLRLYFKVDQNKIIIAYVGEHLDCGQTN